MQRFRSASDRSSERHGATLADRHRTRAPHRDLPPGRTAADLRRRTSERQKSRRDESGRPGAGAATRSRALAAVRARRRAGDAARRAHQRLQRVRNRLLSGCASTASPPSAASIPPQSRSRSRATARRSSTARPPAGSPARALANPPTPLRLPAPRGRARLPALSLPSVIRSDFVPAGDSRAHIHRYWRVSVPGKGIGTSGVVATGSAGFAGRKHISARSSAG